MDGRANVALFERFGARLEEAKAMVLYWDSRNLPIRGMEGVALVIRRPVVQRLSHFLSESAILIEQRARPPATSTWSPIEKSESETGLGSWELSHPARAD